MESKAKSCSGKRKKGERSLDIHNDNRRKENLYQPYCFPPNYFFTYSAQQTCTDHDYNAYMAMIFKMKKNSCMCKIWFVELHGAKPLAMKASFWKKEISIKLFDALPIFSFTKDFPCSEN